MSKVTRVREDVIRMLRYRKELSIMEHFLNQQFGNIKSDQKAISKYILKAADFLEIASEQLIKQINDSKKIK